MTKLEMVMATEKIMRWRWTDVQFSFSCFSFCILGADSAHFVHLAYSQMLPVPYYCTRFQLKRQKFSYQAPFSEICVLHFFSRTNFFIRAFSFVSGSFPELTNLFLFILVCIIFNFVFFWAFHLFLDFHFQNLIIFFFYFGMYYF